MNVLLSQSMSDQAKQTRLVKMLKSDLGLLKTASAIDAIDKKQVRDEWSRGWLAH